MGKNLRVCHHCLMAIESREGKQATVTYYIDDEEFCDDYENESRCDWCEENGFSELYELI